MTKRQSLSLLIAAQMLAYAAGAFAEGGGRCPVNFDGGPGCGSIKLTDGVGAVPGVAGSIVISQQDSEQDLNAAKTQLEELIARIDEKLKSSDTPPEQQLELFKWRQKVQTALDKVNKTLAGLAQDKAKNDKQNKLDSIMAQAAFLNKMLASYLGNPDFARTIHMKEQPFDIEVGGDAVFEAVRKRVPFLGGAIGGRIRIKPGAEMVSQFNSLKAEYYTVLLEAAQTLKDMGKNPGDDRRLSGMAQWGKDTKVINPGQGWMDAKEILDRRQYQSIID